MFIIMVIVFLLGYLAIALEHPLHIDKAIPALIIGSLLWVLYIFGAFEIFTAGLSKAWNSYMESGLAGHGSPGIEEMRHFIAEREITHHLGEISEILFFLLGAMTIVEITDQHDGFKVITDHIRTTNRVKLLWILSILTFFMSAALDNLTTTIVMVALLRKLVAEKKTRWFFASMIVLAANAGGAWSPIGDVTTIMLWIGGQVTTVTIIVRLILPSLVSMVIPLALLSFTQKGKVSRPVVKADEPEYTTMFERRLMLILGVSGLLFVPVFKTITHLPPYQGMLLSLAVIWLVTEIMHHGKSMEIRNKLRVVNIVRRVEFPTIFFFLGILSAVAALQSAGQLNLLAHWLDEHLGNIYLIDLSIGILSSIVDNVPLVAGAMGMYPIVDPQSLGAVTDPLVQEYARFFIQDGLFWEFLAYCAGVGGSLLIIGSAAGVAAMGMEKIDFIWYMKRISLLALLGYLAGAGVYFIQAQFIHH
jgi:Na+/H+ antiporter NhaD/arsenite permease-like protein